MKHYINYINKSALVAEIERLISNGQVKLQESQESNDDESYVAWSEHIATCIKVLSIIDTLEVKEVVAEQKGICNGILNTIVGYTWHIKIPLNKVGLKHGDKVKIFITTNEK